MNRDEHKLPETLGTKRIYDSKIWQFNVDKYRRPDGSEGEYSWATSTNGAAITVLRAPPDRFLLINLYRYPSRRWMWEFVAGVSEPGEAAADTAVRETREEVGIDIRAPELLGSYVPISGLLSNRFHVFLADIDYVEPSAITTQLSESIVEARWFSDSQLREAVRSGQIECGSTLTALSMYWARTDAA